VGYGRGEVLAGDDESDLTVREAELVADQRQQQIKGRGIPVREAVADGDQPQLPPGVSRRGFRRDYSTQAGTLARLRYCSLSSVVRMTFGPYSRPVWSCSRSFTRQALWIRLLRDVRGAGSAV